MSVALRYINRELVAVFLTTLAMLLLVAVGGRFIGYLQDAALGKYSGITVLTIMALRVPEFLQQVAPFAMYVAIVLTLGRMHAEQEMVVLQGAGAGTAKLLKWLSISVVAVALGVALLSWVLTPLALRTLSDYLIAQQAQTEFETVNPGSFHAYDRGTRVTYSEDMSEDKRNLRDIFLSQRLEDGRQINVWAKSGRQEVDAATGDHFLVLERGRRYEQNGDGVDLRIMEFDELRQRLQVSEARRKRVDVEALAAGDLQNDSTGQAEWHWRLALPLFCLIGGVLGVGISRVKPRQGRFARIVPAAMLMLIYYLALLVNRNALAEGQIPAALGMWVVHMAFAGIAWVMLRRVARPVTA